MKKGFTLRIASMLMAAAMATGVFAAGIVPQSVTEVYASKISQSKAENIALKNARTSSSKVYAEDIDDTTKAGKDAWRVSFFKKKSDRKYTHFVYFINMNSGDIILKKSQAVTLIRPTRAKDIALDEEDYDRDEVEDLECDLDEEDDKMVYNVSFTVKSNNKDYDYTINARSGNVMDSDDDD